MKPRLLDLYAGAGGAARGYQLAGFHVTGVDIAPQPNYAGDEFWQGDALALLAGPGFEHLEFDLIHASPPCQTYSTLNRGNHPDLYGATRKLLEATGLPWVMENVEGAPFRSGIVLCGSMFNLPVRRHRNFESSVMMMVPPHHCPTGVMTVTGHTQKKRTRHSHKPSSVEEARAALGIDWPTTLAETVQAIPPAMTEFIGTQLMAHLDAKDRLTQPN